MSDQVFQRIREEFDWEFYVTSNFMYKQTPDGQYRINCISCGETDMKLYISPLKHVFHCFKCPFSSKTFDVFDFYALGEGINRAQAMIRLTREFADTTPEDIDAAVYDSFGETIFGTTKIPIKTIDKMPEGSLKLVKSHVSEPFWDYLTNRGLTDKEIEALGCYYVPTETMALLDDKNKYRGDIGRRIIFPVYGGNHELVSWQARTIRYDFTGKDKYVTCPGSELAKTVWPYVKPFDDEAILVEGILDCLSVRRVPGISAYATFTKKVSEDQLMLLRSWGIKKLVLWWDKKDSKKDQERAIEDAKLYFDKIYVLSLKDWPLELDTGKLLEDPDGSAKIKRALEDRVDSSSLDFIRWKISY